MITKETSILSPYLVSLVGVLSDYLTTNIGVGMGFTETNLSYNPILSLAVFWGTLCFLTLTLPKHRVLNISRNIVVLTSFLGAINNIVVITIFAQIKRGHIHFSCTIHNKSYNDELSHSKKSITNIRMSQWIGRNVQDQT